MPPRIVPVIDVLNGVVVRGIAGRRSEYRPIQSRLTNATDPLTIAFALYLAYQPREIYLADLDAIQGGPCSPSLYADVLSQCSACWVDAGINSAEQAIAIAATGCHVIAGLETIPDPATLRDIAQAIPHDRLLFSLDLRNGVPLRTWPNARDPIAIVEIVQQLGLTRVIVLDLAAVGTGRGPSSLVLLQQLHATFPTIEFIAGGGVRSSSDIDTLGHVGVRAVLVASALHDGGIVSAFHM